MNARAFHGLCANRWLWGALALLLQAAVVRVGLLDIAFGTVPVDTRQWFVRAALGSVAIRFAELRKAVLRRF